MRTLMTAGKGGTGKSMVLAHLLKRHILPDLPGRVLVVDADPHQSLTRLLGIRPAVTLGSLRREHGRGLQRGESLAGLGRREFARRLTQAALQPLGEGADLLVMGRSRAPGCQCVVNTLLGRALDALAERYAWVVVDNEAGIEPIGRHTWPVDVLLLLASPKALELEVAGHILRQAEETQRTVRSAWLIVNRHRGQALPARLPAPLLGRLPYSDVLDSVEAPDSAWLNALDELWENAIRKTPALQFVPV